jgi:hypothetical protein
MKNAVTTLLLLLMTIFIAQAQKLPNVQQASLHASANVKIDGKSIEWGDQFQAYSKIADVYYSIANDDNNIYLIARAKNEDIIEKISKGGITFTIGNDGEKRGKNNVAITFPMYDEKDPPLFIILDSKPKPTKDTLKNKMQTDSFTNVLNLKLKDRLKIIGVAGVKAIEDNVISIYNMEGIKAAAFFDDKLNYTYELAVPLKYLTKRAKFSYNIKLNGAAAYGKNLQLMQTSHGDILTFTGGDGVNYTLGPATPQNMIIAYPTDFWGEYTLAKK